MVAIKQQHMNSKRVHTGYTLTTEDSQKKGIIIARSSCTVLQDYVDIHKSTESCSFAVSLWHWQP